MLGVDPAIRTTLFQKYTVLQVWLFRRFIWYVGMGYLFTLIFFALLRLFTGISIKRIGYFSLRHISFSPHQGLEIRIGKLGLIPHRPTIARPGYFTFVLNNLEVVADTKEIQKHQLKISKLKRNNQSEQNLFERGYADLNLLEGLPIISKKHPKIAKIMRWLLPKIGAFNILFHSASIVAVDINTTACTSANLHVDLRATRNLKVSNFVGTLDSHRLSEGDLPINIKLMLTDIYTADSLDDETPWQLFDDLRFDLIAFLNLNEMKIRNMATQIHTNRLQVDVSQFLDIKENIRCARARNAATKLFSDSASASTSTSASESTHTYSKSDKHKLIKGSKILLHLLNRVQLTAGTVEVQQIPVMGEDGQMMLLASSMKDLNIDLTRMNPSNSGFRLLYDTKDAAHQILFTVASLTVGIDTNGTQEEVLYVPLITSLSRGNLFSRTLSFVQDGSDTNMSAFRSRWAVNSPNVSLEHHQLSKITESVLDFVRAHRDRPQGDPNLTTSDANPANPIGTDPTYTTSTIGTSGTHVKYDLDTGSYLDEYQSFLPKLDFEVIFSDPAIKAVCDGTDEFYSGDGLFVADAHSLRISMNSAHVIEQNSYVIDCSLSLKGSSLYYNSATIPRVDISSCKETTMQLNATTKPTLSVELVANQENFEFKAMHYEVFRACGLLATAVKIPILNFERDARAGASAKCAKGAEGTQGAQDVPGGVPDVCSAPTLPSASSDASGRSTSKPCFIRSLPKWLTKAQFNSSGALFMIASDRFRSHTNDLLGVQISSESFNLSYYNEPPTDYSTDGRLLTTSASNLTIMKADKRLLCDNYSEKSHRICNVPKLNMSFNTHSMNHSEVQVSIEPRLRVDLNINLILAFSVCREIVDFALARHINLPVSDAVNAEDQVEDAQDDHTEGDTDVSANAPASAEYNHVLTAEVNRSLIRIDLPSDDQVMFEMTNAHIHMKNKDISWKTNATRMYSEHPFQRGAWCILTSLVNLSSEVHINDLKTVGADAIKLNLDQFRLNVPYQFKLYRIIDNGITLAKAIKTLLLQTKEHNHKLVLDPKKISKIPQIPQIRIGAKQLLLTLEDDYFESDLQLCMSTRMDAVAKLDKKLSAFEQRVKHVLQKGKDLASARERTSSPRHSDSESSFVHAMHKTTTVFGDHLTLNHSPSSATHSNNGSNSNGNATAPSSTLNVLPSYDRAILRATLYAVNEYGHSSIIDELLCESMELGSPELDKHKPPKGHAWLEFWSIPAFKPFRDLVLPLSTGEKGKLNISEAREMLVHDFSRAWIDTVRYSRMQQHLGAKTTSNSVCIDELDSGTCSEESIVDYSDKPLLSSVSFKDMDLLIKPTEFNTNVKLHEYLYTIGKGLPMDSDFSILLPMNIDLKAQGGLCVSLRDYPLPVLHFPQLSSKQNAGKETALRITGPLVVTEQMNITEESIRKLYVPLKPGAQRRTDILEVRRTLTPIKTYTDLNFLAESSLPTRLCWCKSYGPAFKAVGQAFSSFSKPPLDPSPALGFWDKIRLILHARFSFILPKSHLLLMLKGGKSPYALLDDNSGFVFSWKKNTRVLINSDDDPKKLIFIDSDFYELYVPDFAVSETEYLNCTPADRAFPRAPPTVLTSKPAKVVFSFPKKSTWKLGMVFEKSGMNGTRNMDFRPHYDVKLSMPDFVDDAEKEDYDAYEGFRSDFIHMSISVVANKSATDSSTEPSTAAENDLRCTTHLTQGVIKHFKSWKRQFTSEYWPPIRTGSLFPDPVRIRPSNKTFGAALSTAEYQIALAPVDLSFFHYLKHHKSTQKFDHCTGLKAKMDEFVFDWHTRREPPIDDNGLPNHSDTHRRWKMHSYLAEVNLKSVSVKVIDAKIRTKYNLSDVQRIFRNSNVAKNIPNNIDADNIADDESMFDEEESDAESTYTGKTEPSTHQTEGKRTFGPKYLDNNVWVDLDDYTEIGRITETKGKPIVSTYPFLYSPQICYIRKTDYSNEKFYYSPDKSSKFEKFIDAGAHDCLISHTSSEETQCEIIDYRLNQIKQRISEFQDSLESLTLENNEVKVKELREYIQIGEKSIHVLNKEKEERIQIIEKRKAEEDAKKKAEKEKEKEYAQTDADSIKSDSTMGGTTMRRLSLDDMRSVSHEGAPLVHTGDTNDGNNCDHNNNDTDQLFVNNYNIHAVHLKWNNTVRNLIYRLQVSLDEDRELYYVRCRRSVQYLEELVAKATSQSQSIPNLSQRNKPAEANNTIKIGDIEEFFGDLSSVNGGGKDVAYSHNVKFTSPRVQLIAEESPDKCLQLVSRDIELQVIDIYCQSRPSDIDSAQIEKRMGFMLRNAAFFAISKVDVESTGVEALCLEEYSGEGRGNSSWPPWLSLETCYEFDVMQKFMIVKDASFCVRYDQPNDLHVVDSSERKSAAITPASQRSSMDSTEGAKLSDDSLTTVLVVNAPQLLISMDSEQFATVYMITMDLLTYRDPLITQREEAINRVFLSTDFSGDYNATLRNIELMQADINTLVRLREKIYLLSLNNRFEDQKEVEVYLIKITRQYTILKTKLTVLIRAFKASLRRRMKTGDEKNSKWLVNADKIIMQVLQNDEKPLAEAIIRGVRFSRTMDGDNGNTNKVSLSGLYARNSLEDAVYPQMIATMNSGSHCAFKASWTMLNRVGGIPVVEDAEIRVEPIRIQLEQSITDKLLDFVFPIKNSGDDNAKDNEDDLSENAYEDVLDSESDVSIPDITSTDGKKSKKKLLRFRKHSKSEAPSVRSVDSGVSKDSLHTKSILSKVLPRKPNPDDVDIMLKRASNYQAIRRLRINPMELTVSYRSGSSYSLLNIHNLRIPMSDILIENKTWSRLDIIMKIKKEVVKTLVSQSGSILSNKFKKAKEIDVPESVNDLESDLDTIEPILCDQHGLTPAHRTTSKLNRANKDRN